MPGIASDAKRSNLTTIYHHLRYRYNNSKTTTIYLIGTKIQKYDMKKNTQATTHGSIRVPRHLLQVHVSMLVDLYFVPCGRGAPH